VTSIIANPDTDPHAYEPTPADGRRIASAQYVISNGVGYDAWMAKLLTANPVPARTALAVGALVGKKEGDNPHRWYFPGDVETVTGRITADYKRIDRKDAAYFDARHQDLESTGLAKYHQLLSEIKQKYAGTPVGASESIFVGIAEATGLKVITPSGYLTAISEGTDPTARDKATVDGQIRNGLVKVFVYNTQNSTPDVKTLVDAAKAKGIPTPTVTETLTPAGASFEDWQVAQLQVLRDDLAEATGR
jgi:zinc/manganese transport system substrate-binding protein